MASRASSICGSTPEELGVDHTDLHSPVIAGAASFAAFSIGALLSLLPYLLAVPLLELAMANTAVSLVVGGVVVNRLTGRLLLQACLRQLGLGGVAVLIAYGIGRLTGSPVS